MFTDLSLSDGQRLLSGRATRLLSGSDYRSSSVVSKV